MVPVGAMVGAVLALVVFWLLGPDFGELTKRLLWYSLRKTCCFEIMALSGKWSSKKPFGGGGRGGVAGRAVALRAAMCLVNKSRYQCRVYVQTLNLVPNVLTV